MRLSKLDRLALPFKRAPAVAADHARKLHHNMPLKSKIAPSATNASGLSGAVGSMNCRHECQEEQGDFRIQQICQEALRIYLPQRCRRNALHRAIRRRTGTTAQQRDTDV